MVKKKTTIMRPKKEIGEAFGIAGFTLSIASFATILFAPYIGLIFSAVAIIFCAIQQKKKPTKKGKIGLVLGIIGFLLSVYLTIIAIVYLMDYINSNPGLINSQL